MKQHLAEVVVPFRVNCSSFPLSGDFFFSIASIQSPFPASPPPPIAQMRFHCYTHPESCMQAFQFASKFMPFHPHTQYLISFQMFAQSRALNLSAASIRIQQCVCLCVCAAVYICYLTTQYLCSVGVSSISACRIALNSLLPCIAMATANFHFEWLSECFIESPVAISTISCFTYTSWSMRR